MTTNGGIEIAYRWNSSNVTPKVQICKMSRGEVPQIYLYSVFSFTYIYAEHVTIGLNIAPFGWLKLFP